MALSKILPASQEVQAIGKNLIINGNFDVWQRGVTIDPVSSSVYGVDRWANFYSSINAQQTFALGQTDVSGIVKYSSRWTAKTTSGTAPFTRIEDVTILGGKSITVSFYAKVSTEVTVDLRFAQRFGSGGSATNFDTITDALTITTSWQKFTYTTTLASIAGKTLGDGNNTEFAILATDLTTNDWIELSQVQLEVGSTATPFEHRSYGDELIKCQRYCAVITSSGSPGNTMYRDYYSTDTMVTSSELPVQMRVTPTITMTGSGGTSNTGFTYINLAATPTLAPASPFHILVYRGVASSARTYIYLTSPTGELTVEAEL
jgi:hypothetical protein